MKTPQAGGGKIGLILLLALLLLLGRSARAQGDIEAVNYNASDIGLQNIIGFISNGTIGWAFSSSQAITIDSLGLLFAGPSPPSAQDVDVGLWSADGTLLRSTVINNGSVIIDGNYYATISPILIPAGSTFVVAIGSAGNPMTSFASLPPTLLQPNLNFIGLAYSSGSGFTFPTVQPLSSDFDSVPGATFLFQAVPEPSGLALTALGTGLLGCRRRRGQPPAVNPAN